MIFDPLYILFMLPATLLGLWAQFKLSSTYGRYRRVGLASGMSGAEAAREILARFATRAFHRPATPAEVEKILAIYDLSEREGDRFLVGVKDDAETLDVAQAVDSLL